MIHTGMCWAPWVEGLAAVPSSTAEAQSFEVLRPADQSDAKRLACVACRASTFTVWRPVADWSTSREDIFLQAENE